MGLSATGYERVRLVEAGDYAAIGPDRIDQAREQHGHLFFNNPDFDRGDDLTSGLYAVDGDKEYVEQSYVGFGRLRDAVCEAMFGIPCEVVWATPAAYEGQPFWEWIHFADNEGFLGSRVSTKLAIDFADQREKVTAFMRDAFDHPDAERLISLYDGWVKVARVASSGEGAIRYS
jgi:hypothetical protein